LRSPRRTTAASVCSAPPGPAWWPQAWPFTRTSPPARTLSPRSTGLPVVRARSCPAASSSSLCKERSMATPLIADRLVAALRAEGVTVREVSGWRTNNRNHKGAWGPVNGVIVHHTVTGPGTDVVGLIYRGHSSLPGPLATGCITKDGTVHLTGNGRANHAGGGDPNVLAAVIAESYRDRPPAPHEHDGSSG